MTVEVKTKLTLDESAVGSLKKIRDGFDDTSDARDRAQAGFDTFKQTMSTLAAVHGPAAIAKMIGFGKSFLDAAREGDAFDQTIAGMIATMQDVPWEEARERAELYGDELDSIAIKGKKGIADVEAAFHVLNEVQGATQQGLQQSTHQLRLMVPIARVLNKPVETVSREFAFMGEGMLKAKSQLFQILKGTGIFGDNAKKAAGAWAAMTDEQRAERLNYALETVSSKLGKATPTFNDLVTTLDNVWEITKEKLGDPILAGLMPRLEKLVDGLDDAGSEIEKFARDVGTDLGQFASDTADALGEGLQYVRTHKEEIRDAIVSAMDHAKAVVEFILAHKEEIAIAFGAKMASPLLSPAFAAGKAAFNLGAGGTSVAGAGLSGLGGGLASLGAFTAAIVGATAAVDQFSSLMNEQGGSLFHGEAAQGKSAIEKQMQNMLAAPDFGQWGERELKHFDTMRKNLVAYAEELGENSRAAGELADRVFDAHKAARKMVQPVDDAAAAFAHLFKAEGGLVDVEMQNQLIGQISSGFQGAQQAQNAGAQQYIANLLAKSTALQTAFLESATLTADGFNALATLVQDQAGDFAEKLRAMGKLEGAKGGAKPMAPKISMGGGNIFKINQEFRDQDPDRVAVVFKRDVARAAFARLQASTSSPFGT